MMITGSNITINVRDLDKSVLFYQSLGLVVTNRWGDYYAQLASPGVLIGLHPTETEHLCGNSGNTSIGFTADNFEEARSLLQRLSIPNTERKEEGGEFLHFQDPDGTSLYFIKPKW